MHNSLSQATELVRQMERQRKKDCDYVLKQESEMEKMREGRAQAVGLAKVQEEQINRKETDLVKFLLMKF